LDISKVNIQECGTARKGHGNLVYVNEFNTLGEEFDIIIFLHADDTILILSFVLPLINPG